MGYGEAVAHGATTIVNAIATGRGAALGVNLYTKARVQLTEKPRRIEGRIVGVEGESLNLIREAVRLVLRRFGKGGIYGAVVETESNIPIAKGLKSSSAAANALVLATAAALGEEVEDVEVLNLSVEAALRAKTTITGAFDDACASFLGGIVVTDNTARQILKRLPVEEDLKVIFQLPDQKSYTITSDVKRMRLIAPQVEVAHREALSGRCWEALTMNGILYASALGYNPAVALDALAAGALAAGLSGKGPATAAVVPKGRERAVVRALKRHEGEILEAAINQSKATVLRRG